MGSYTLLKEGLLHSGISADDARILQFDQLTKIMLAYNQQVNLTRITEPNEIVKLHYLDSVSIFSAMDVPINAKVIDVGTGAGFPGLPMKIVRDDLQVTLLDSLNKRIHYLDQVIAKLQLEKIETIHARSEELGKVAQHREQYDIAVSRAVAHLPKLCEFCLPFVKVGGYFVSYKGPGAIEEADEALHAIRKLGGELVEIKNTPILQSDTQHHLVIIKKVKATPKEYPRKNGMIQKSPL